MFDITSSKLLILGVVALLVIGPKDLPALLRTLGKYMGMIRRQANEFRAQFEEAMRESELAELKQQVETIGSEAEASVRAAEHSVEGELKAAASGVDAAVASTVAKPATDPLTDPLAPNGDGLPDGSSTTASPGPPARDDTMSSADAEVETGAPASQATRETQNSGA